MNRAQRRQAQRTPAAPVASAAAPVAPCTHSHALTQLIEDDERGDGSVRRSVYGFSQEGLDLIESMVGTPSDAAAVSTLQHSGWLLDFVKAIIEYPRNADELLFWEEFYRPPDETEFYPIEIE